jgi:hypothetical protein
VPKNASLLKKVPTRQMPRYPITRFVQFLLKGAEEAIPNDKGAAVIAIDVTWI